MPADPLLAFRPEFPILAKTVYLISNSLGAMPKAAAGALVEYAETWAPMLPNVTTASAVVPSSLEYAGPRRRIVMVDGEFPSIRSLYESLGARLEAEIVTVPSPRGDSLAADEGCICDAIDERAALSELDRAFAAVDGIRASGAWRRRVDRPAVVT